MSQILLYICIVDYFNVTPVLLVCSVWRANYTNGKGGSCSRFPTYSTEHHSRTGGPGSFEMSNRTFRNENGRTYFLADFIYLHIYVKHCHRYEIIIVVFL